MPNTYYFTSPIELNPIFLKTFGLSVKSEGAIGQFGTGLKYAIAVIMRHGGEVKLKNYNKIYKFIKKEETIRGKIVNPIYLVDEETGEETLLPFTAELGKNWEPWMAFRELLANSWDEGGDVYISPTNDPCTIEVRWRDFDNLDLSLYFWKYLDADKIKFLAALEDKEKLQLFHTEDPRHQGRVYYKGIFVHKIDNSPFTYKLGGDYWAGYLTEDRTLFGISSLIDFGLVAISRRQTEEILQILHILDNAINAPEWSHIHPRFFREETLLELSQVLARGAITHPMFQQLIQTWELSKPPILRDPNEKETRMLMRALEILKKGGVRIPPNFWENFKVANRPYNSTIMATASLLTSQITITETTFDKGLREVIISLLEEITHISTGARDETRKMQLALLELWLQTYCHLTGEII